MRLLDLFSGTGSVAKTARKRGWITTTLDKDLQADLQTDILTWDYKTLPPDSFDYIHASPPCTHYSKARTTAKTPRDIEGSNLIVSRTLEIIKYFNPKFFTIENPQSGLLKKQPMMQELSYNDIDYCKYGKPYRKRTRFWNNFSSEWHPRLLCNYDSPCESLIISPETRRTRHEEHAQRFPSSSNPCRAFHTQHELYSIPTELIIEILELLERLEK